MTNLALLRVRTNDNRFDEADFYCPYCDCRKNGYVEEANGVDECCDDSGCDCHNEELGIVAW